MSNDDYDFDQDELLFPVIRADGSYDVEANARLAGKQTRVPTTKNVYAVDHLGRDMSADEVCQHLSVMLGWATPVSYPVLERSLRELKRKADKE